MLRTVTYEESKPLKSLMDYWSGEGNELAAGRARDLINKLGQNELTIAFCGHFSAGKSSLINSLCRRQVLPSGPVPTSANVVMIRDGEPRAVLHRLDADEGKLEASAARPADAVEVNPAELGEYCRNGDEYRSIEVWEDIPLLQGGAALLDTPGVDSTDSGHALATDSALHLADVVFYVMDYNHVQSENNLSFAKRLSDWGKPLYLIVNQIDKHRSRELSFTEYRRGVEAVFAAWQVNYADLIFTSVLHPEHELSQWNQLEHLIAGLIQNKVSLIEHSIISSLHHLGEQHLKDRQSDVQEEMEALLAEAGGEGGMQQLQTGLDTLTDQEQSLKTQAERALSEFRKELDSLLANANITPAQLRDAAGSYLESRKPGFKAGFLFAGNKTEQERARRLELLVSMLRGQVEGQVDFHVRSLLRELGERYRLWSAEWESRLTSELPETDAALVAGLVREGAISPEYTLQYSKDLRAEITARYRRAALALAAALLDGLTARNMSALEAVQAERAALLARSTAAARYAELQQQAQQRAAAQAALLPPRRPLTSGVLPEVDALVPAAQPVGTEPATRTPAMQAPHAETRPAGGGRRRRLERAAARLEAAAALVEPYAGMGSAVRSLRARAKDLAGGRFTLALFGAFSAGKSSFANALLGEPVLPVSPHPTTAAINRILAPEEGRAHGTAVVTMKTREAFEEDLRHAFQLLGLGAPRENWREMATELSPQGIHPAGRPQYSFIRAAAAGWHTAEEHLGERIQVNMEEYRSFVADEQKSCFVSSIDLHYSCELTEQGIVIVDTPGADSVNARHTGVTFEYMKNADALIFVTYYNHAFSQGDRQFLMQLGRVKDTLALNNMFFIINASDLASSDQELGQVQEHVAQQLKINGISLPRLYPLSSLQAMEAKETGNSAGLAQSGFLRFEEAFTAFAGDQLPALSEQSVEEELRRLTARVSRMVMEAEADEEVRTSRLASMEQQMKGAKYKCIRLEQLDKTAELAQETGELLYHVRQRVFFRLGSLMAEAFHSSVLREGTDLKRGFMACGRELMRMLSLDLNQELLALTLNLEQTAKKLLRKEVSTVLEEVAGELPDFEPALPDMKMTWPTPPMAELNLQDQLDWGSYWRMFKNPRSFFEGGGRSGLQQALEPKLREAVEQAVTPYQQQITNYYSQHLLDSGRFQADQLREQLGELEGSLRELWQQTGAASDWQQLLSRLETR
ncbi:dynamin family protein [Paenibacillus sp. JX-17]|uniref:Dynamin family protein n=1 Tax=Paenibacillus lacisoli TaxID=3064525 RepID=A0ABT9C8J9_9BACL|nr:dynamin family protein [Paenibacillus sp. JX-17]MDO7905004.1 dynamin family protein [Paenibacillus sp. JX-17]